MPDRRPLVDNTPQDDDPFQLAKLHLQSDIPAGTNVTPANWLERLIMPGDAIAKTYPWGRVSYFPERGRAEMSRTHAPKATEDDRPYQQGALDDILAHELVHVRQGQKGLIPTIMQTMREGKLPYMERPSEQEAFGEELSRKARRRDIQLPPDKP